MDLFGGCAVCRCRHTGFRLWRRGSRDAHRAIVSPEHNERRARIADSINVITDTITDTITHTDTHAVTHAVTTSGAAGTSVTCASGEKHRQALG